MLSLRVNYPDKSDLVQIPATRKFQDLTEYFTNSDSVEILNYSPKEGLNEERQSTPQLHAEA